MSNIPTAWFYVAGPREEWASSKEVLHTEIVRFASELSG